MTSVPIATATADAPKAAAKTAANSAANTEKQLALIGLQSKIDTVNLHKSNAAAQVQDLQTAKIQKIAAFDARTSDMQAQVQNRTALRLKLIVTLDKAIANKQTAVQNMGNKVEGLTAKATAITESF